MRAALDPATHVRSAETPPRSVQLRSSFDLALGEGRRVLRHRAVLSAIGITILIEMWTALVFIRPSPEAGDAGWIGTFGLMPLVVILFVVSHLLGSRDRRHGLEELYGSMPAVPQVRTIAALMSAVWLLAAAAIAVLPFTLYVLLTSVPEAPSELRLLATEMVFILALCGAAGVAVGRWLPAAAVGPIAGVGLVFVVASGVNDASFQAFFGLLLGTDALPALGWHLAYIAGLIVAVGSIALLRDGVRRGAVLGLVFGLALAGVAGALQLPDFCLGYGPCHWT